MKIIHGIIHGYIEGIFEKEKGKKNQICQLTWEV